jgi:hypothetical protein
MAFYKVQAKTPDGEEITGQWIMDHTPNGVEVKVFFAINTSVFFKENPQRGMSAVALAKEEAPL